MPDTKITALAAITTVAPANDLFAIVDVSDNSMAASGTTKNITTNQILGAGGTATLASATITGDLTVRTNKLFVNATGVGIGTTSVLGDFTIQNGSNCRFEVTSSATGTVIENLNNARNAYLNMTMYADAYIWNRLGSEAMRLNSTGLGVGVTPSAWDTANYKALQVSRTAVASLSNIGIFAANWFADTGGDKYIANGTAARIDVNNSGQIQFKIAPSGTAGTAITDFATAKMTLDASGNLLVGTTTGSFRGQFAVASGADRNIFTAQVTGASNGLQVLWNHATTTLRIVVANLPTSSAGLATGTLWIDTAAGNTLKVA